MKVEDVMTTDVRCCHAGDSANRAAQIMWAEDVGFVPVLLGEGLVGVVTDRDIAMAAYAKGRPLNEILIDAIMTREVFSCSPEDRIQTAEHVMARHQVRRLPVLDDGHLVGLLSLNDIARASQESPREVTPREISLTLGAIGAPRPIGHA